VDALCIVSFAANDDTSASFASVRLGRLSSFVVLLAQQRLARGDKGACAKAPRRHGSRPGVRAASEPEPAPVRRVLDGQAWFMS
jgi:hypothetical protein